jgi:hypothetical protein
MVKRRSNAAPSEPIAVTGIASGGLGTAANLEDTQLWNLEDLRAPVEEPSPEPAMAAEVHRASDVAPVEVAAPVVAAAPATAPARMPRAPRRLAKGERPTVQPAQPVPAPVVRARRGQRRTGPIAAAVIGIVALAAVLALRDGLPGGATRGSGDAAGAFPSTPPIATSAPKATAAPDAGGGGGGGHGNGGGKGKGNGGKDH